MTIRDIDTQQVMTGSDYMLGIEAVTEDGRVVMSMAAMVRAEVHMSGEPWSTPGARWELLQMMHREMNHRLKQCGVQQAVTWFDKAERFCRRLTHIGWKQSEGTSYHWRVR